MIGFNISDFPFVVIEENTIFIMIFIMPKYIYIYIYTQYTSDIYNIYYGNTLIYSTNAEIIYI